jgi:cytoskeletal protein CcmA (bactofilin family)
MIGAGTTIRGSVTGDEDLVVEGNVEGSIRISKDLTIGKSSAVTADIEVNAVSVQGTLKGNAQVDKLMKVDAGAGVVGDVTTPRIHIADGAHFSGRINMDFDIPAVD